MTDDFDYVNLPSVGDTPMLSAPRRQQLLDVVEELGDVNDACCECHMTASDLQEAMEQDQTLHADITMAIGRCRASIRRRIHTLAFEGYEVPVIGGKDKDKVVATQTLPDQKALDIIAKMHFSKDMAQYNKVHATNQEIKPVEKDDAVDMSRLKRAERTQWDALMSKARGHIKVIDEGEKS